MEHLPLGEKLRMRRQAAEHAKQQPPEPAPDEHLPLGEQLRMRRQAAERAKQQPPEPAPDRSPFSPHSPRLAEQEIRQEHELSEETNARQGFAEILRNRRHETGRMSSSQSPVSSPSRSPLWRKSLSPEEDMQRRVERELAEEDTEHEMDRQTEREQAAQEWRQETESWTGQKSGLSFQERLQQQRAEQAHTRKVSDFVWFCGCTECLDGPPTTVLCRRWNNSSSGESSRESKREMHGSEFHRGHRVLVQDRILPRVLVSSQPIHLIQASLYAAIKPTDSCAEH